MIFVTLGTQKFQLNRLLIELDRLVEQKLLNDDIYAQIGNSTYYPKYYSYSKLLSRDDYERMINECDLLITHAGVGTILQGLKLKKKIIVFPRLERFNEHVDDHQLQIASNFANKNYVLMCKDESDLEKMINGAINFTSKYQNNESSNKIVDFIINYLSGLDGD